MRSSRKGKKAGDLFSSSGSAFPWGRLPSRMKSAKPEAGPSPPSAFGLRTPLWGLMQCRIEQVLAFERGCIARLLAPHRLQAR
jgi:hypothetical protein